MARTKKKIETAAAAQPAAAPETAPPTRAAPKGKLGVIVELLRSPGGMTIAGACAATGWQAHSVRGAMAGSIKKKLGLSVASKVTDGVRVYRICEASR